MPERDSPSSNSVQPDVVELGITEYQDSVELRRPARETPRSAVLGVLLVLAATLLAGTGLLAYLIFRHEPSDIAGGSSAEARGQAVPAVRVEPVAFLPVTPQDARAINAAVPFSTATNPAAAPIMLRGSSETLDRAVDCLAAAAWYEARDDAAGAQAVVQVVLNRMRHAAFPNTVCGVVFQGSERTTGCQFTFSCDGSLARRRPGDAAWQRARLAGAAGLNGLVFTPVGWATHYHTDWVVPNWSRSVEKIAALGGHLFFRWPGGAGRPSAFRRPYGGAEPRIAQLAALSLAHRGTAVVVDEDIPAVPPLGPPGAAPTTAPLPQLPAALLRGNVLQGGDANRNLHVVSIKTGTFAGTLALMALDICKVGGARGCTIVGFIGTSGRVLVDGAGHLTWPDHPPDFFYYRDPTRGREQALWNCSAMPRTDTSQCIPRNFSPAD